MSKPKVHSCFFVTPIGADGSPQRKRADDVLKHVLRSISKGLLDIVRADEVDEPGTITSDIIARLYNADLVIADLTGQNANVFYEVGLRHAFNKPIVQICQDGEKLPFDIMAERTVFFDISDIASVAAAKEKIQKYALAALNARPYKSPVQRALALESLFHHVDDLPIPKSLVEKLDEMASNIEDIESEIASIPEYFDLRYSREPDTLDEHTISRLRELASLLDQVSPADVANLVAAVRALR
jgi:hypothetical protein